ncbi:hypothetical protein SP40_35 [Salmonella phage 40]|nr:hypothetical protein SP40_35 [Salmonella phage 40]
MVASFPLKVTKNGDKTYVNGSLSGKTFNILDESKAGQPAPRQQPQQGAQSQQSGGGVKVYGEITAIVGNLATVNDEKTVLVRLFCLMSNWLRFRLVVA